MSAASTRSKKSTRSTKATNPRAKPKAKSGRRWVATVRTVSTFPPESLFTKDAGIIARSLASKKVSPKGPGSGMRMLNYFINRGGRGLSATRRAELEKAKRLLSERIKQEGGKPQRNRQGNARARAA
jgi:tRNA(adenine34) deaminase